MSNQSLPASMSITPFKKVDTMHIDTQILDPATITKHSARFVLQRKGILNTGSSIQIGCIHNQANNTYFYPLKTGIHAVIKSATLRIGTNVIAQTDENGFYQTMTRQFKTNEQKTRIDSATKGTCDGMIPDSRGDNGVAQAYQYMPSIVHWLVNETNGVVPGTIKPTNDSATTALFSVKLSELFPVMRDFAMPLFAIAEPVSIELVFNTQSGVDEVGKICCKQAGSAAPNVEVSQDNCKMIVDYLTYSDDRINEVLAMVMSKSGLVIPYSDLMLSTSTVPAVAVPGAGAITEQKLSTEIGFSGKTIKNLMWMDTLDTGNAGAGQPTADDVPFQGAYTSQAYMKPDTYQIRVNDMNVYNRPVENEAMKHTEVSKVMGNDICVGGGEYSMDYITEKTNYTVVNNIFAAVNVEGHSCKQSTAAGIKTSTFDGLMHVCGCDLITNPATRKGTMISQKPILIERTLPRTQYDATQRTVRTYGMYERTMVLQNGQVSVSA